MKYLKLLKTYISIFWNEYRNNKEIMCSCSFEFFLIGIFSLILSIIVVFIEHGMNFPFLYFSGISFISFAASLYLWLDSDKTKQSHKAAIERCKRIKEELEFKDNI